MAITCFHLGRIAEWRGDFASSETVCQHGLAVAREIADQEIICSLLLQCGEAALYIGEFVRAKQYLLEGLPLAHQCGNEQAASMFLKNLGEIADSQGDHVQAKALLQNLGVNAERGGEYMEAEVFYQEGHHPDSCVLVSVEQANRDTRLINRLPEARCMSTDIIPFQKSSPEKAVPNREKSSESS